MAKSTSTYYPEFTAPFRAVLDALGGKKTAVLCHLRPDGDAVGSQVALTRCLNAIGVEALAVGPDPIPHTLQSFVGDTPYQVAADFGGDAAGYTAVTVDCADAERVGRDLGSRFPEFFANIDHHISNTAYAGHNFIHAESSATAEILAGLFFDLGLPIDPVTAHALYVGIATDTGQFRFASTTHQVFEIACHLVERGADPAAAAVELYERESRNKLDLLQRFLASFRYACDGRVCIGLLPEGIYEQTGAHRDDSEGLVDYTRAIEGVEIGVLLEERNGSIKGSFRAKDPAHRVDLLAKPLNGGGHACAAGFNTPGKLDPFLKNLLQTLDEHFSESAK